jgi:hypothetical protein
MGSPALALALLSGAEAVSLVSQNGRFGVLRSGVLAGKS